MQMNDSALEDGASEPMFDAPLLQADYEQWALENVERLRAFQAMSPYERLLALSVADFLLLRHSELTQRLLAIANAVLDADRSLFTDEQADSLRITMEALIAIQAHRQRDQNLALGRRKGAETQRDVAQKNKEVIIAAFRDLMSRPEWSRKTLTDIAAYLARNYAESHRLRQANGKPYAVSTIRNWIKGVA